MSGLIDDLVKKFQRAKRHAEQAQRRYDEAQAQTRALLKELEKSRSGVQELESAIQLLRNNLKPASSPTPDNVTQLQPKK